MKRFFLITLLVTTISKICIAQVTVIVDNIPENTPSEDDLYIVGNFNDWNPADPNYILEKQSDGSYKRVVPAGSGTLKYKFTRGSWDTVEGDANGGEISDREFTYGNNETINVQILSWKDLVGNSGGTGGTAADNVTILSEDFFMPQLNRSRRIWLYLPPDYGISTDTYPVIYMHDGQNLFNNATSFAGEWQIDESINALIEKGAKSAIIVGIDNGGSYRIDELTPWTNSNYGGGDGDKYVKFITETLKPFVDLNYRTKPERLHTGIMGSSLGGLISYYAAIQYPEIFGMAGIFSPSFWFSNEVYSFTDAYKNESDSRFHFLMGEKESANAVSDMNSVISSLTDTGFPKANIKSVIKDDGTHSEWFWAREFSNAYLWMLGDTHLITNLNQKLTESPFNIYPNPASKKLNIEMTASIKKEAMITIFNMIGTKVDEIVLDTIQGSSNIIEISISKYTSGFYVMHYSDHDTKSNKSFVVK